MSSRHVVFGTGQIGRLVAERLIGVVNPAMREYLHTLYQFSERWVVDDTAFRTAFGTLATPLDDALATTTTWYRDAASLTRAAASREPNPVVSRLSRKGSS